MKRYINNILRIWALTGLVLVVACEENLDEINTNPNLPEEVPSEFVLPSVLVESAHAVYDRLDKTFLNLWVQQWGSPVYADEDQYELRESTLNTAWDALYANAMTDAEYMVDLGLEQDNPNHAAIGLVMKVYIASIITNLWGDIPYSDALNARTEDGGILSPTFDSQEQVYSQLLSDLDRAIGLMNPALDNSDIAGFDFIYAGDMLQWEKFANSLKLRLYMNMSEVDPTAAESGISSTLNLPIISSNDDNAEFFFGTTTTSENPVANHLRARGDDYRVSKTLIDEMVATGTNTNPLDPRLPLYAALSDNGVYEGELNGQTGSFEVSKIGEYYGGPGPAQRMEMPFQYMIYPEILFIQAEAAQRGWIAGDVEALYEEAITASMEYNGITDAVAINAYLADPSVAFNAGNAMELISVQKWLALYMQGTEAFNNWRRTGFPDIQPSVDNRNNDQIPRRLEYPTDEFNNNSANTEAAVSRQGGATQNDRIWIDPA